MTPIDEVLESYLRYPPGITDPRLFKALGKALSRRAQGNVECAVAAVTGRKLVVVCESPKWLKEVIFVERKNPARIVRWRLTLKRKQNAPKA